MTSTTLFTVVRLYSKQAIGSFAFEDYLSILVWMQFMAYNALIIDQGKFGLGRHIWDVPAANASTIAQDSCIIELMYICLIWTSKVCLLVQLLRIFVPTKTGIIYHTIHALIWGNLAFTIAALDSQHAYLAVWTQPTLLHKLPCGVLQKLPA
ncbi:hypothetical protein EV356DRAFT_30720 [Viridothelium virens]|uniref:Rhodopsin domain-containing protein n=1 Tax=Viridothelium virens TaxID=1048519 RepID=A0A6A6HGL0_VIRVR|nr:hypothetical protein EV356DRAFT_30720 [Viridothelium virens]